MTITFGIRITGEWSQNASFVTGVQFSGSNFSAKIFPIIMLTGSVLVDFQRFSHLHELRYLRPYISTAEAHAQSMFAV